MDRAVQIAGTTYESVPSVTIPTAGGGEASFVEISDTTAVATDVAAGKIFYTSEGVRTSGTASGGGGDDVWSGMVDRTISQAIDSMGSISAIGSYAFYSSPITNVSMPNVTTIGMYAFYRCSMLSSVSFPNVVNIGSNAFNQCKAIVEIDFPKATILGNSALFGCTNLKSVDIPNLTGIPNNAFAQCSSIKTISFSKVTTIGSWAFNQCSRLSSVYLLASSVVSIASSNVFDATAILNANIYGVYGSIFVPESLYSSYLTTTKWTYFSTRLASLNDAEIQNVLTYGTHEME